MARLAGVTGGQQSKGGVESRHAQQRSSELI